MDYKIESKMHCEKEPDNENQYDKKLNSRNGNGFDGLKWNA